MEHQELYREIVCRLDTIEDTARELVCPLDSQDIANMKDELRKFVLAARREGVREFDIYTRIKMVVWKLSDLKSAGLVDDDAEIPASDDIMNEG